MGLIRRKPGWLVRVPIESVTARIVLPRSATGVRATAFNGAYGSTRQEARVAIDGTSLMVTMPEPLGFREGVTAVIQPGGSMRDAEVLELVDGAGATMLVTGTRHFRH